MCKYERGGVCVCVCEGEEEVVWAGGGGVYVPHRDTSPGRQTAAAYGESCKTVKLTQLLSVTVKIN